MIVAGFAIVAVYLLGNFDSSAGRESDVGYRIDPEVVDLPPIDEQRSGPSRLIGSKSRAADTVSDRDVGGVTLSALFTDARRTISDAASTLRNPECLEREFSPDGRSLCSPRALYEVAMLIEYCGRGQGPSIAFDPERLDLMGETDLAARRRAAEEQDALGAEAELIERKCRGLRDDLMGLPRLTDETLESQNELVRIRPNVPYLRLHASLLGDHRAMRWLIEDWSFVGEDYLSSDTVQAVLRFVDKSAPAEGHRLRYQFAVSRAPEILLWTDVGDRPRDEDRLVEAAAHLLAWERLAPDLYDQPADLRWMNLHESSFLERLDENTKSLAQHRANQMLNQ